MHSTPPSILAAAPSPGQQLDWAKQVRVGTCWTLVGRKQLEDSPAEVQAVRVTAVVWEGSGHVDFVGQPNAQVMRFIGQWIEDNRYRLHGLPDWRGFAIAIDIFETRGVPFQTWEIGGAALVAVLRALVSVGELGVQEDMTPVLVALDGKSDDVLNGYDPVSATEGDKMLALFARRRGKPRLAPRLVVPRGMLGDLQVRALQAKVELTGVSNMHELITACVPSVVPFSPTDYPEIATFTNVKLFRLPDYDGTEVRGRNRLSHAQSTRRFEHKLLRDSFERLMPDTVGVRGSMGGRVPQQRVSRPGRGSDPTRERHLEHVL